MAPVSNNSPKQVKVEDLLRLKRNERPQAAFWNEFDQELHQRMLRTLVKKDAWYIQLMRACSGRLVQTVGVSCAAAFIAMLLIRPSVDAPSAREAAIQLSVAAADAADAVGVAGAVSVAPVSLELAVSDANAASRSDYQIDTISTEFAASDQGFTRDFKLEGMLAANDESDYSMNFVVNSATFGSTGVASLVF